MIKLRPVILCALLIACFTLAAAAQVLPAETLITPAYPVEPQVQLVLDIARGELGYPEMSDGSTKYGEWAGDPKAQWCAEFLCWTVDQAGQQTGEGILGSLYPNYQGTNTGRDWFIAQGRYIARKGFVPGWGGQWYKGSSEAMARDSYIPQPGDWVFLSYDSSGDTAHVAMVENCYRLNDGSGAVQVQVIEGNNPSAVARARYRLDDWRILGYGTVRDLADTSMRMGHSGEKVKALQQRLNLIGLLAEEDITGFYSQRTSDALKVFQASIQLNANGIANQATQLALSERADNWLMEHTEFWVVRDEPDS